MSNGHQDQLQALRQEKLEQQIKMLNQQAEQQNTMGEAGGDEEANDPARKKNKEGGEGEEPPKERTRVDLQRAELQKDHEFDDRMKGLLREEKVLFVKKFELFEFQTNIKQWIEEAVKPLVRTQATFTGNIEANRRKWVELDSLVEQAATDMNLCANKLGHYKELEDRVNTVECLLAIMQKKEQMDGKQRAQKEKVQEVDVKKAMRAVETMQANVEILMEKDSNASQAMKQVEKTRDDCFKMIDNQMKVVMNEVLSRDQRLQDAIYKQENIKYRTDTMDDLLKHLDSRVQALQKSVSQVEESNYSLNMKVLAIPDCTEDITFLQGELRQMRMLNQQNIEQTQKELSQAISQKDCEQTCLKFNFDMMQQITEKLEEDSKRNMLLKDQLYIEAKAWQASVMGKVEENDKKTGIKVPTLKEMQLKNSRAYRKEQLEFQLAARKLKEAPHFDKFGSVRCNSTKPVNTYGKLDKEGLPLKGADKKRDDAPASRGREETPLLEIVKRKRRMSGAKHNVIQVSKLERVFKEMDPYTGQPYTAQQEPTVAHTVQQQQIQVLDSNAPKDGGAAGKLAGAQPQPPARGGRMASLEGGYTVQRNKRKKEKKLGPDDMVYWGAEGISKFPLAPKGMQFVNMDNLIDLADLEAFKEKFAKDFEFMLYSRIEEYDANLQQENKAMLENIENAIDQAKSEFKSQISAVVSADIQALDSRVLLREQKIKTFLESELYNYYHEMVAKDIEQKHWNEQCIDKLALQNKAIYTHNSDALIEMQKIKDYSDFLKRKFDKMEIEFAKMFDLVNSVVELQYLSQLMEFQDEVDRHQMSLWAMEPHLNTNGSIKTQPLNRSSTLKRSPTKVDDRNKSKSPDKWDASHPSHPTIDILIQQNQKPKGLTISIDEDCFGCSLEKYRPLIKQAFKMACIQYKPGAIAFKGKMYERKSLINLKRMMAEQMCGQQLYLNQYFQRYLESIGATPITQDAFYRRLSDKLGRFATRSQSDLEHLELNIEELVLNRQLKQQIIKNPSTEGLLYGATTDRDLINKFKKQVSTQALSSSQETATQQTLTHSQLNITIPYQIKKQNMTAEMENQLIETNYNNLQGPHEALAQRDMSDMGESPGMATNNQMQAPPSQCQTSAAEHDIVTDQAGKTAEISVKWHNGSVSKLNPLDQGFHQTTRTQEDGDKLILIEQVQGPMEMKDIAAGDSKERLLTESLGLNEEEEHQVEMADGYDKRKITSEDTDKDEEQDERIAAIKTGQSQDSQGGQQILNTENEFYMHGKVPKKLSSKAGNYDIQNEVQMVELDKNTTNKSQFRATSKKNNMVQSDAFVSSQAPNLNKTQRLESVKTPMKYIESKASTQKRIEKQSRMTSQLEEKDHSALMTNNSQSQSPSNIDGSSIKIQYRHVVDQQNQINNPAPTQTSSPPSRKDQDYFSKLAKQTVRKQKDWSITQNAHVASVQGSAKQLQLANVNLTENLPNYEFQKSSQQSIKLRNAGNSSQIIDPSVQLKGQSPMPSPKRRMNQTSLQKGSQVIENTPSMHQCEPHTSKASSQRFDFNVNSQQLAQERARNVQEALNMIGIDQKKEILSNMIHQNASNKKYDNLSIITGVHGEGIQRNYDKYDKEIAIAQISALSCTQTKGHGTGYMYSRNLVENLSPPHQQPKRHQSTLQKSPINIQRLYTCKNSNIQNMSVEQTLSKIDHIVEQNKRYKENLQERNSQQFNFNSGSHVTLNIQTNSLDKQSTVEYLRELKSEKNLPKIITNSGNIQAVNPHMYINKQSQSTQKMKENFHANDLPEILKVQNYGNKYQDFIQEGGADKIISFTPGNTHQNFKRASRSNLDTYKDHNTRKSIAQDWKSSVNNYKEKPLESTGRNTLKDEQSQGIKSQSNPGSQVRASQNGSGRKPVEAAEFDLNQQVKIQLTQLNVTPKQGNQIVVNQSPLNSAITGDRDGRQSVVQTLSGPLEVNRDEVNEFTKTGTTGEGTGPNNTKSSNSRIKDNQQKQKAQKGFKIIAKDQKQIKLKINKQQE